MIHTDIPWPARISQVSHACSWYNLEYKEPILNIQQMWNFIYLLHQSFYNYTIIGHQEQQIQMSGVDLGFLKGGC